MSLEQQLATLTDEVKALSSSISILTATMIAVVESQKASSAGEAPMRGSPEKRTRRTKEQIAADEAAAAKLVVKPEEQATPAPAPVDPAKAETEVLPKPETKPAEVKTVGEHLAEAQAKIVPTKEELIAKFQALVAKFGKDKATEKAREIINALGAANVSGIPEDKRAEAIAKVDAELAKV